MLSFYTYIKKKRKNLSDLKFLYYKIVIKENTIKWRRFDLFYIIFTGSIGSVKVLENEKKKKREKSSQINFEAIQSVFIIFIVIVYNMMSMAY